jgi:hypothetical protein
MRGFVCSKTRRGIPLDKVQDLLPQSAAYRQASRILIRERSTVKGRPLTPLHRGHVSLLATAGMLNGVFGQGEDRHIAHWRSVKFVDHCEESEPNGTLIKHAQHHRADAPVPVLSDIHGDTCIAEEVLEHWEGYRGSGPVRIGNAAVSQVQMDVYGEMMDALYLYNKYVSPIAYDMWLKIRERMEWICKNWQRRDAGIWEMRNREEHFTYSKVMNWVALDRGIRLADKRALPADRSKWLQHRDRIYEEVMSRGWNPKRGAFTQFYGSADLDASLLIMPLVLQKPRE